MKKFLALLSVIFLSFSLTACADNNIYETVFVKEDRGETSTVTLTHQGEKVTKIKSVSIELYKNIIGGRNAVKEHYENVKNNNPLMKISVEYGEDAYTFTQELDLNDIVFKEYLDGFEFLGLPISDGREYIDYDGLVEQYIKQGYKEKK